MRCTPEIIAIQRYVLVPRPSSLITQRMAPPPFIYVMKDLRKVVPPSREILRGIWLSFYYGAKIGVLGANGAGKSSLLRIMAGVDHDFQGEAWAADGTRIGYLAAGAAARSDRSTSAATSSSR